MSFHSAFELIRNEVLEQSNISGKFQQQNTCGVKEVISVKLNDVRSAQSVQEPAACSLVLSSADSKDSEADDTQPPTFHSPNHRVQLRFVGADELLQQAMKHCQDACPLLLEDLCRTASLLLNKCGFKQIAIECSHRTAQMLAESANHLALLDEKLAKHFLSSVFVLCHLARVYGEVQIESNIVTDSGDMSIKVGDQLQAPLRLAICPCLNGEDLPTREALKACIDQSSTSSHLQPVYLCIFFDEISTCEWYLRTKGAVSNQKNRLPNHDTTRVQLKASGSELTIRISAFDLQNEKVFQDTGTISPDELSAGFCDDAFLKDVIHLCEQLAKSRSKFRIECFTVPCRNTIHLLQAIAEMIQDSLTKKEIQSMLPSVSLKQAAAGDTSELLKILELSSASRLHDPHESFPHRTALLCAAAASVSEFSQGTASHAECVRVLISRGADPGVTDSRGHTVLHCAVLSGSELLVTELLATKVVDVNSRDANGKTALHLAVEEGNSQIARSLLADGGADCHLVDKAGRSALTLAVASGSLELVKLLVQHEPDILLPSGTRKFCSYFWAAWKLEHQDICLHLLSEKFSTDEASIQDAENMGRLIIHGKEKEFDKLLTAENCDWRDWEGKTLLMIAASRGSKPFKRQARCAELLLNRGAAHSATDLEGNTPLHLAAAVDNFRVVKLLLNAGASPSARNLNGATPFVVAEQSGHEKSMSFLRSAAEEAGSSASKDEPSGQSTMPDANRQHGKLVGAESTGIHDLLPAKIAEMVETPHVEESKGRTDEALQLRKVQAQFHSIHDPTKRDEFATDAANAAAKKGQLEVVKFLVPTIADKTLRDQCCKEAAESAKWYRQWEMVKFLVPTIADQKLRDQCCKEAARYAANNGQLQVVKFLVPTIADQKLRDQCCKEAAESAAYNGQLEVVNFLAPKIADQTLRDKCCKEAARSAANNSQLEVVKLLAPTCADQTQRCVS